MKTFIKTLLVVSALGACSGKGIAQSFNMGVKAAFTTGTSKFEDIDNKFVDGLNGKGVFGYEAGLLARFKFGAFFVRPELLYNFTSGDVSYTKSSSGSGSNSEETTKFSISRLQVPLIFGINLFGPYLAIEAGPMYTYAFSVTDSYNGVAVNFNRSGLGYRIGLGSQLGPIILDLNYQGLQGSSGSGNARFSQPSALMFGVGLLFGELGDK